MQRACPTGKRKGGMQRSMGRMKIETGKGGGGIETLGKGGQEEQDTPVVRIICESDRARVSDPRIPWVVTASGTRFTGVTCNKRFARDLSNPENLGSCSNLRFVPRLPARAGIFSRERVASLTV